MERFKVGDWVVIVDKRPEMNGRYDGLICKVTGIYCYGYKLVGFGLEKDLWSEDFLIPASEVIKKGSRLKVREDLSHNMCPMPLYSVNIFMGKLKGNIVTVDCFSRNPDGNMEIILKPILF